jgi:hypothetical protein
VRGVAEQAALTIGIQVEQVKAQERGLDALADGMPSHWEIVPDNGRCFSAAGDVYLKSLTDLEGVTTLRLESTQRDFAHSSQVLRSVRDEGVRVNEEAAGDMAAWQAAVDGVYESSQAWQDQQAASAPGAGAGGQDSLGGSGGGNPWGSGGS